MNLVDVSVVVGSLEEGGFIPVMEAGSVPQPQPVFSSAQQVSATVRKHMFITEMFVRI